MRPYNLEDSLEVFQTPRFKDYINIVDKQTASMDDVCEMYIDRCRNVMSVLEVGPDTAC